MLDHLIMALVGDDQKKDLFKRQTTKTEMITEDEIQFIDDEYTLTRTLGEPGTFGMCFECFKKLDPSTLYAAKRMNKRRGDKNAMMKMKDEIDIMNEVKHNPYICTLHKVYEDRNYIYLVLDYLSGGELYVRIQECLELPEGVAQTICKQIFHAVKYMHSKHIAHLDLKSDNIMFVNNRPDSPIKVIHIILLFVFSFKK